MIIENFNNIWSILVSNEDFDGIVNEGFKWHSYYRRTHYQCHVSIMNVSEDDRIFLKLKYNIKEEYHT